MTDNRAKPVAQELFQFRGWSYYLERYILVFVLVALCAVTAWIEPRFLSARNLESLARQLVPLTIAAVGQAFVVIGGGLDLSIAAVMSLAGVVGILIMPEYGMVAGIAAMILTGLLGGLANGLLIGYLRTTPLIVTLGMLSIAQALALILSNGVPVYTVPDQFVEIFGFGDLLGIPVSFLIGCAALAIGGVILKFTVLGRYIYAIGSSRSAAEKSGIDVSRFISITYVFSGISAGLVAVILTSWVGAAQPTAAPSLMLESIAAIVLGGVALTGGSGSIFNVVLGVVILGTLSNALNMMGVSSYFQMLAIGVVIILAVSLDRLRT
mgnify:CR=1 FL=1